jgi:hypothetical protein
MSRENLERILDMANDEDWAIARTAWFRYRTLVGRIAERHGYSVRVGAAVFAALSPNNDYLGNLRDVSRLLSAARNGKRLEEFKVSTYGANKAKAWRIAHGEDPLDLIVAHKTRNFFLNVYDPTDPTPVTVDGHIFNAWTGKRIALNSAAQKFNAKHYLQVAEDIRQIGADRDLIPNVVQGVIWYAHKRIHRIKYDGQMEFWDRDCMVAEVGLKYEIKPPRNYEEAQRLLVGNWC